MKEIIGSINDRLNRRWGVSHHCLRLYWSDIVTLVSVGATGFPKEAGDIRFTRIHLQLKGFHDGQ